MNSEDADNERLPLTVTRWATFTAITGRLLATMLAASAAITQPDDGEILDLQTGSGVLPSPDDSGWNGLHREFRREYLCSGCR